MAKKHRSKRKSICISKIRYATKEAANKAKDHMKNEGTAVMRGFRPYFCTECCGYHLGHKNKE